MASAIQRYFLAPRVPHTAGGFVDNNFVVVDLRRVRRGFGIASSAVSPIPEGLVTPNFDLTNIHDPHTLASLIGQTAEAAGLANKKQWSLALPEGAARSLVVNLESKPASRKELNEIMSWKIERLIGTPATELFISRQKLHQDSKQERYLVAVARHAVLNEYEIVFNQLGWQVGLMLPRHMGEIQWLMMDKSPGDKMLVSANRSGFTAVVLSHGEPVLVRNYVCEPESRTDDLHRFALYYREKMASSSGTAPYLESVLVIGNIDLGEAQNAISDALENRPRLVDVSEFGLDLEDAPVWFDHLAGAAGLASLAWQ
ncbi:MAG: hypothetical protein AB1757_22910 [Acidobacteriota bacterium]